MNIDFLKETSVALTDINEDIDVANTDEIINAIIETKQYSSLAYQVCEVSPIHGPTAATFALVYMGGKFKLLRGNVVVEDDAIDDTGFTLEAMQDLMSQFGKSANEFIGKSFGGISNKNENEKLISKMSTFASEVPPLYLTNPKNAETIMFELQLKIAKIVLKINNESFKSLDSYAIVPATLGAAVLAISNILPENSTERGLYLGSNSRTKFYLNPDPTSNEIFVGIHSSIPGLSSVIMSPYHHSIKTAVNPETGANTVFNFNRYAITESRLSESQKMLYKFVLTNTNINVPPVADIAGGDRTVAIGDTVVVDGSNSQDAESTTLSYHWSIASAPVGSNAAMEYDNLSINQFVPDVAGNYLVQLVVGDSTDYSDPVQVTITAQ